MGIADKADLLALLGALLDGVRTLSPAERELLPTHFVGITPTLLNETKRAIRRGEDPLGEAYSRILSPESRRSTGTTFTPPELVESMFTLAEEIVAHPTVIVDCGAGSGRFSLVALRRHRAARVVASESNPLLALIVRANAHIAGLDDRLTVVVGDFRELTLPNRTGPTLFIGNPPYVRHHDIEPRWKHWYAEELARHGLDGSRLAGLHLYFFVKVRQLGQTGDAGCFVTSAEWLDTNYGVGLRQLLLNGLGGRQIHLFPAELPLFSDALTTSVITTFQIGANRPGIGFTEASTKPRRLTHWVPTRELQQAGAWSRFARPQVDAAVEATATLGDFFKVQRGQVTGANAIWISRRDTPEVSRKYLFPAVTDAGEIISLGGAPLRNAESLRQVIDLPADLTTLPNAERKQIAAFLEWAEREGVKRGYIVNHRKPWWRVGLKPPPPIVMTYMGRRPPVFARNLANARLLNIAHGLYPLRPVSPRVMEALVTWLNANVSIAQGRIYGGGLVKFEPGEAMRIPVPPLEYFNHVA